MKRSLILTALSFLVLAQLGLAQVPQTISYQGVLRDPGTKEIVPNDNYDLTFRLFDASTGGAEWWSETHVGVQVTDGIFNVILGSINSFISTAPRTRFEIPYWLEIDVGTLTLSPRIELTAVPYSITARGVQGYMNVFPSNGNVGIGTTTPGSKLHIAGPDVDGIMLTDSTTGAYRATLLNRVTMGGQLNLNDAADGAVKAVIRGYASPDGYQASFTAGNVGIGTDRPEANLQVVGNWTLGSPEFQSPPGGFDSWLSANNGILYEGGGADYTHHFSAYGGGDIARFGISTGIGLEPDTRVVITNSGFVGIGTGATAPSAELEVVGGIKADSILLPATERWYSIPAPEFDNNGLTKSTQPYYVYSSSAGNWYAPVHLPHGATITGFEITITDDDSVDASISLYSVFQGNQSAFPIAGFLTFGNTATITYSDLTFSQSVDNQNYTYMVQVYYTSPKNGWDFRIHNARIRYTVTSPLP